MRFLAALAPAVADVNGDGFPDFFASPSTMGALAILVDNTGW